MVAALEGKKEGKRDQSWTLVLDVDAGAQHEGAGQGDVDGDVSVTSGEHGRRGAAGAARDDADDAASGPTGAAGHGARRRDGGDGADLTIDGDRGAVGLIARG